MSGNPYKSRPEKAFWRGAIGQRHFLDVQDLWTPMPLVKSDRIATAGSCFAQHIGSNLALRGAAFMDMEPAPIAFSTPNEARRWGFGVFSCRYGNIYTTRQLLQLFDEAFETRNPRDAVWEGKGRFFDALRPGIDPVGQTSADDVRELRSRHLVNVRKMFLELDVFIFTMGLTEAWMAVDDGTVYPTAPGVVAGDYDPSKYKFVNFTHAEIMDDLSKFWAKLKAVNSGARMLLTISPVPLIATASEDHVLVATTYSKSTLRSVATEIARTSDDIYYFPSYEIITAAPGRGMFFDPDWRSVNQAGVDFVMTHFFSGVLAKSFGAVPDSNEEDGDEEMEIICDEESIEKRLSEAT